MSPVQEDSFGHIIALYIGGIALVIAGLVFIWYKKRNTHVTNQAPAEDANEIPILAVAHPVIEEGGNIILRDNDGQLIVPLPPPSAPPIDDRTQPV